MAGEHMIRLERIGINVADFEIPDNENTLRSDEPLSDNGSAAMLATLPNREIRDALLCAGIPARISATAGTFLCNAALYTALSRAARQRRPPLTGFVHVPYLPEQVAELLKLIRIASQLELHQGADMGSMK